MPLVEIIVPSLPGNVPAFLAKLWKMVENQDTDDYICWTEDGTSFRIRDQSQFASCLLPYYYKHSNMASFVRQLNMYGFHKVIALHSGNLKSDKEEIEFAHVYFIRGQEHLLEQIKRKSASNSKSQPGLAVPGIKKESVLIAQIDNSDKEEMVNEILMEMSQMKERQEDLDNKMENMKSENEALWGEVLSLRQKHNQQQKIVNKLIQFLSALLQPRGMKRSFGGRGAVASQLAIENVGGGGGGGGTGPKQQKLSESSRGPVIQELPAGFDATHISDVLNNLPPSQTVEVVVEQSQAQEKNSKYRMVDPVSVNSSLVKRPTLQRELSREDFDTDIVSMQKDIDNLKDILSGQITLDTSLVSSLFNTSDQDHGEMSNLFSDYILQNTTENEPENVKLPVTYNPSLFELTGENEATLQQNSQELFNEAVLNTPLIQDEQENPLKEYFQ